jgi:predicted transcriptional regulator
MGVDIKTTQNYLDEITRQHEDLRSDAALGRVLGVTRQAVYQYRRHTSMSVYVAVRIAMVLDIDPMETIAAAMYEQARGEEYKQFWGDLWTIHSGPYNRAPRKRRPPPPKA